MSDTVRNAILIASCTIAIICLWESVVKRAILRPWAELRAVIDIYRIRRQHRTQLARDMAILEKLKAKIVSIGELEQFPDGTIRLHGAWQFDCSNGTIPSRVDAKGIPYYCGYSDKELLEIWKRRDEYVTRPKR